MIRILRENNNKLKEIPVECIKGATLLSKKEAQTLLTQEERKCKGTQKAKRNGLYIDPNGYSNYWLRSKGDDYDSVCFVLGDGSVYNDCSIYDIDIGVRPALIINLRLSNLKIGDSFKFGGYTFKIISNKLALCNVIIDSCQFNENEEDGNNYETSYVKSQVDMWLQDAKDMVSGQQAETDDVEFEENDFGF